MIVVIGAVSAVFAILITNFTIGGSQERKQEVEVVEQISSEFKEPDNRYFNDEAINPTQIIRINDNLQQQ